LFERLKLYSEKIFASISTDLIEAH
jgi:hypothetical protein